MMEDYNVDADNGLIAIDLDKLNTDCHINNSETNPIDEILCLLKTEKEGGVTLEHNIILKGIKASIKILKTSAKIIFDTLNFQGFESVSVIENIIPDLTTSLIKEDANLETNNAYTNTDTSYWYSAIDIKTIGEQIIDQPAVKLYEPVDGVNNLAPVLQQMQSDIDKNSAGVLVCNISDSHWISLALVKCADKYFLLYKDSLYKQSAAQGIISTLAENLNINLIVSNPCEQRDMSSCGIFALQNIRMLSEKIQSCLGNVGAMNNLLVEFSENNLAFCKQEEADRLRAVGFAEQYVVGKYKQAQIEYAESDSYRAVRNNHMMELNHIKEKLEEVLQESGIIKTIIIEDEDVIIDDNDNSIIKLGIAIDPSLPFVSLHYSYLYTLRWNDNTLVQAALMGMLIRNESGLSLAELQNSGTVIRLNSLDLNHEHAKNKLNFANVGHGENFVLDLNAFLQESIRSRDIANIKDILDRNHLSYIDNYVAPALAGVVISDEAKPNKQNDLSKNKEFELYDKDSEPFLLLCKNPQYIFQMYKSGKFENKILSKEGVNQFIQAIDSSDNTQAKKTLLYTLGCFLPRQEELIPFFEKHLVFDLDIEGVTCSLSALHNLLKHVDAYQVDSLHIEKIIALLVSERLSDEDTAKSINIIQSIHKLASPEILEKWLLKNLDNKSCNANIYNCFSMLLYKDYYLHLANKEVVGSHQLELMENILTNESLRPDVYSKLIKLFTKVYETNHSYKLDIDSINFLMTQVVKFREETNKSDSDMLNKLIEDSFSLLMLSSVNLILTEEDEEFIQEAFKVACISFRDFCSNTKFIFNPMKMLFSELIKKATLGCGNTYSDKQITLLDTLYSEYQEMVGYSPYKLKLNTHIALEFAKINFSKLDNNTKLTELAKKVLSCESTSSIEKEHTLALLKDHLNKSMQGDQVGVEEIVAELPLTPAVTILENKEKAKNIDELLAEIKQSNLGNSYISDKLVAKIFAQHKQILDLWEKDSTISPIGKKICDWGEDDIRKYAEYFQNDYLGLTNKSWTKQAIKSESREELLNKFKEHSWLNKGGYGALFDKISKEVLEEKSAEREDSILENAVKRLPPAEAEYILELLAVIKQANIIASDKDPRDIQMLSILLLLSSQEKGLLLQINTGEGKSIITALLAAVRAMQGEPVDIITSSSILAKRDAEDPEKQRLFNMLGLTVSHNAHSKRGAGVKECYLADIVYGDVGSFQYDLIDIRLNKSDIKNGRKFGVVIVDEVDSMLIDESAKIAMVSRSLPGSEFLQPIYSTLWTNLLLLHKRLLSQAGNYFVTTGIFETNEAGNIVFQTGNVYSYDEEEQEYILIAKTPAKLDIEIPDQEISKIKDFTSFEKDYIEAICKDIIKASNAGGKLQIPAHLQDFVEGQMDQWVKALLEAKSRSLNKDYVVVNNEEGRRIVAPVDFTNTGIINHNTQWSNGLHQILQVKELLKLSSESLITTYISNMGYFQNYGQNIYGVTGTLGSSGSQALLKDVYDVDLGIIPTFKEKQFEELQAVLVIGQQEHDAAILESIQKKIANNRAVLVICDTIFKAQNVQHYLSQALPALNIKLYSRTDNEESMAVETRISCKDIIVATNLAGRGTDIKTTADLEAKGGLHVCVTYLPSNQRVEDQALGRTSRQGNYGSGELIINLSEALEQLHNVSLDPQDIDEIDILKQLRHAQEEDRLLKANLLDVNRIKLEDDLFKDFCALHQQLKLEDNHREKLMQVQELWGLLLKQIKAGYSNDEEFPIPQISHKYADSKERAESYNEHHAIKAKAAFDIFAERMQKKYTEDFAIFENHNYLVQYANNHMQSGELNKSIEALEAAIKVDTPYKHNAYYSKAYALISKESIECARSGKASHNNNADTIYSLLQAKDLINSYIIPHIQSINITVHEVGDNDLIKQSQDKIKLYETYVEHIDKVIKKIQNCENNNYIAIDNIKFLEEYFPDDEIPHDEIREMAALGLLYIFDVKEVSPPVDWGTCLMLATLAVIQIGVGILCACTGHLTIATSLVLSGLSDFEKCYNVANGNPFSWNDYFTEKAITIGVTLLTLGAQNLTSTLNLNWLKPLELAKSPLANLAINVASAYTLNKGLDAIKDKQVENIVKELRGEIRREVDKHLNAVFSDKVFLENIEKLLIFDSVQSNSETGQTILKKVEEVLVSKTNKMNALLKMVLHSVAKQSNIGSVGGAAITVASYASKGIDIANTVDNIKKTIKETCSDIHNMVATMASEQSIEKMLNDSITIASKEEISAVITLLKEKKIINEFGQLEESKIMKADGIKETTAWEMLNFPVELNYLQSRVKGKIRSLYESHKIDHKEQIEQLRVSICTNMQEGIKSKVSKGVARPLADMADDYVRPYLQEALKVISKNVMGKVLSERAKENLVRLEEKFGEKSKEYLDNIRSAIGKEESYEDIYNRRSEEIAKHQAKINKKYEQRQLNGIRGASPAEYMTPEVSYISPRISGVAAGDSYGKESKYQHPDIEEIEGLPWLQEASAEEVGQTITHLTSETIFQLTNPFNPTITVTGGTPMPGVNITHPDQIMPIYDVANNNTGFSSIFTGVGSAIGELFGVSSAGQHPEQDKTKLMRDVDYYSALAEGAEMGVPEAFLTPGQSAVYNAQLAKLGGHVSRIADAVVKGWLESQYDSAIRRQQGLLPAHDYYQEILNNSYAIKQGRGDYPLKLVAVMNQVIGGTSRYVVDQSAQLLANYDPGTKAVFNAAMHGVGDVITEYTPDPILNTLSDGHKYIMQKFPTENERFIVNSTLGLLVPEGGLILAKPMINASTGLVKVGHGVYLDTRYGKLPYQISELSGELPKTSIFNETDNFLAVRKLHRKGADYFDQAIDIIGDAMHQELSIHNLPKNIQKDLGVLIKTDNSGIVTGIQHMQDHHMLLKSKVEFQELFAKAGMSIDESINMLFLPDHVGKSIYPTSKSQHSGMHAKSYYEKTLKEIPDLLKEGAAESWTPARYQQEILKLVDPLKSGLNSGEIQLNSAKPLLNKGNSR